MGAVREYRRGWGWPCWPYGPRPSSRRDRFASLVVPSFFLFFLIEPVSQVFGGTYHGWVRAVVVATVLGYAATYVIVVARGQVQTCSRRERVVLHAIMCLFPIVLALLLGPDALTYSTYVISSALMSLPRNVGALIGIGFVGALATGTKVVDGAVNWSDTWIVVVLAISMFAFIALVSTIRQLKDAQVKMAKLAVAEERSRLARDLHDVLGHSLTTITVKAGLARRVLESSTDRDRAIAEVRDVEDLARQAMTEVRATVSGYRTPSLAAELVGARAALQAAGIAADLPQAVDSVSAELREAFAYVIREGVTNVVRHSGATRCEIRLGTNWLEVTDNGTTRASAVTASRANGGGHGLSGLAERVESVGASLTAGPRSDGGFQLKVTADVTSTRGPENVPNEPVRGLTPSAKGWAEIM